MSAHVARRLLTALAVAGGGAGAAMALLGRVDVATGVGGAIVAGAVAGLYLAYRGMRPLLGRATAGAAIALAGGLVFMTVATTSPVCPLVGAVERCTPAQTGAVTLTGVVAPLAYLSVPLLLATLVRLPGRVWRAVRRSVTRLRGAPGPRQAPAGRDQAPGRR